MRGEFFPGGNVGEILGGGGRGLDGRWTEILLQEDGLRRRVDVVEIVLGGVAADVVGGRAVRARGHLFETAANVLELVEMRSVQIHGTLGDFLRGGGRRRRRVGDRRDVRLNEHERRDCRTQARRLTSNSCFTGSAAPVTMCVGGLTR